MFSIETFCSGQCDIFETSLIARLAIHVLAYPISEEIQWGKPGHELGGFLAQQLKFQQENDEIFMVWACCS